MGHQDNLTRQDKVRRATNTAPHTILDRLSPSPPSISIQCASSFDGVDKGKSGEGVRKVGNNEDIGMDNASSHALQRMFIRDTDKYLNVPQRLSIFFRQPCRARDGWRYTGNGWCGACR